MADDEYIEEEEQQVEVEEVEVVQPLPPPLYEVRPGLGQKFQAANVKDIILTSMQQQLMGRQYRADQAPQWVKAIANGIRQRVQELEMNRMPTKMTTPPDGKQSVESKSDGHHPYCLNSRRSMVTPTMAAELDAFSRPALRTRDHNGLLLSTTRC